MRLWVFGMPVCRIGFVDDIPGSYFLGSDWGLPWCYPRWAWFSATSLWHCQINQTHVKPRDLGTKLISYISADVRFKRFTKNWHVSAAPPAQAEAAEKTAKKHSVIGGFSFSFSSNCPAWNLAENAVTSTFLSLFVNGREYSNFEFVKNVSDWREKR